MEMSNKHILDVTCGSRSIWFRKDCDAAVFCDRRWEDGEKTWRNDSPKGNSTRQLNVHPDLIADFTDLPFDDESFELVVFDPPHLTKINDTAWLAHKYGKLHDGWQAEIRAGWGECMRVLKPYGVLIFKWSEIEILTRDVINAIGVEPLFGHRSGKKMNTHWMCFMKGVTDRAAD